MYSASHCDYDLIPFYQIDYQIQILLNHLLNVVGFFCIRSELLYLAVFCLFVCLILSQCHSIIGFTWEAANITCMFQHWALIMKMNRLSGNGLFIEMSLSISPTNISILCFQVKPSTLVHRITDFTAWFHILIDVKKYTLADTVQLQHTNTLC